MENKSNDLRHTIEAKDKDGNDLIIKIRLNDECHNGHQDFSITGSKWEAGKPHIDRYSMGMGCIHEMILDTRPDLQIFVNLHLCDYAGIPMHCSANGFYHLHEQMNNAKPGTKEHAKRFCEYYRITPQQFEALSKAENEIRFALLLEKLGVFEQWKEEADKAIKLMEEFTGLQFVNDSKRSQYIPPTPAQRKEEAKREKEGYYTTEKIEERKKAKIIAEREAEYKEIADERKAEIEKADLEYKAKKAVLDGGLPLDNFILYNHTKEGTFNWNTSSPKVTEREFRKFKQREAVKNLQIHYGVIFKLGEKGK